MLAVLAAFLLAPASAVATGVTAYEKGDYAAAVKAWRAPAAAGDADAQYNLAQAYRRGTGVVKDMAQAEALYRKAATKGHAQAETNLALILFQASEKTAALPWFEKAAAQGEPRAQYVLGTALFNGDGIAKDWPRAYAMMSRATAAGVAPARASLKQMETWLSPTEKREGTSQAQRLAKAETVSAAVRRPAPIPRAGVAGKPGADVPDREVATKVTSKGAKKTASTDALATDEAPGRGWRVQLGAFSSETVARDSWRKLSRKVAALDGNQPQVEKAGRFVRLRSFVLKDAAAAKSLCTKVKAAGAECFPVAP